MDDLRRAFKTAIAFRKRFGEGHYFFLLHAAIPLTLTVDLLYCVWHNFQRDIFNDKVEVQWLCVSDLILSGILTKSGYEKYEMKSEVRSLALNEVIRRRDLGKKRIREISNFLLGYMENCTYSKDAETKSFVELQKLTALSCVEPSQAIYTIEKMIRRFYETENHDFLRLNSIIRDLKVNFLASDNSVAIKNLDKLISYTELAARIMDFDSDLSLQTINHDIVLESQYPVSIEELVQQRRKIEDDFFKKYSKKLTSLENKQKYHFQEKTAGARISIQNSLMKTQSIGVEPPMKRPKDFDKHVHESQSDSLERSEHPSIHDITHVVKQNQAKSSDVLVLEQPEQGEVLVDIVGSNAGRVNFNGVSWKARSFLDDDSVILRIGTFVTVLARTGNCLLVVPPSFSSRKLSNLTASKDSSIFNEFFQLSYNSLDSARHIIFDDLKSGIVQEEIKREIPGRVLFENVSWRAKIPEDSNTIILRKGEEVNVIGREFNVLLVVAK